MAKSGLKIEAKIKVYGANAAVLAAQLHFSISGDPEAAEQFALNFAFCSITIGHRKSYHWLKTAQNLIA